MTADVDPPTPFRLRPGRFCLLYGILLLVVGLWPFNFLTANGVSWLENRNGLEFLGSALQSAGCVTARVQTDGLLSARNRPVTSGALGIELWLSALDESDSGRRRILSLLDEDGAERLFIGQWRNHLLVRWPENGLTGSRRWREISARAVLAENQERFVTLTSNASGSAIYLEGQLHKSFPGIRLLPNELGLSDLRLVLGDPPSSVSGWSGRIFGLALHGQFLKPNTVAERYARWRHGEAPEALARYDFSQRQGSEVADLSEHGNTLSIASRLGVRKKPLAGWSWSEPFGLRDVKDIAINLFGFLPFGALLLWWRLDQRPGSLLAAAAWAVLLGTLCSLVIELVQVVLPTRDSSVRDVLCNALGTALGLWPAWRLRAKQLAAPDKATAPRMAS